MINFQLGSIHSLISFSLQMNCVRLEADREYLPQFWSVSAIVVFSKKKVHKDKGSNQID